MMLFFWPFVFCFSLVSFLAALAPLAALPALSPSFDLLRSRSRLPPLLPLLTLLPVLDVLLGCRCNVRSGFKMCFLVARLVSVSSFPPER